MLKEIVGVESATTTTTSSSAKEEEEPSMVVQLLRSRRWQLRACSTTRARREPC